MLATWKYVDTGENRWINADPDKFDEMSERLRNLDMMTFAVKEISEAKLKKDEDVSLEEEQTRLVSYEKIYSDIVSINQSMSNDEKSVVSLLKKIRRDASHLALYDAELEAEKVIDENLAILHFLRDFIIYDEEKDTVGIKVQLNDTLFINSGVKVALDTVLTEKVGPNPSRA